MRVQYPSEYPLINHDVTTQTSAIQDKIIQIVLFTIFCKSLIRSTSPTSSAPFIQLLQTRKMIEWPVAPLSHKIKLDHKVASSTYWHSSLFVWFTCGILCVIWIMIHLRRWLNTRLFRDKKRENSTQQTKTDMIQTPTLYQMVSGRVLSDLNYKNGVFVVAFAIYNEELRSTFPPSTVAVVNIVSMSAGIQWGYDTQIDIGSKGVVVRCC